MNSYWHPQWKWQLISWFQWKCPEVPVWKWKKMSKRQLYGKYKEVRDNE